MEPPATGVPVGLTAEEIREQAQLRWFKPAEVYGMLTKHETLDLRISERQERPRSGAIFIIDNDKQKLRDFRKDGRVWAKKKDGKTIQESHEKLKVGGVEMLNCLYAYGETENNFQRRIYRMINTGDGDIALFHYRELEDEENKKNGRRGKKTTEALQSSQEVRKVIPTSAVLGSSSVIVDHISNQLPLPSQTANRSNLNIQEHVESAGCSSGNVNHDNYQLPLAPKTSDKRKQNSIQANGQPSGSSFGIVNHENYQLSLPAKTTDSSNQSNIQANAESAGDGMLHYDYEFENQSFSQETKNDFFTNPATPNYLPSPTPGSPSELPDLLKYMEPYSEGNKKNLKRGKEILEELPANSFGEEYQDHMSIQQNPGLQKGWNNCKRCRKTYLSNIQRYTAPGGGMSFKKVIENDIPPKSDLPDIPCEWELIKNVEQFPEFILPTADPADYFGDITNESLLIRFEKMLSLSSIHPNCLDSNVSEILLKKKFHLWLQEKASEGDNGVTVLDEHGAGVIHLAAGLGYDWAIEALVVDAKIDINLDDKNGCTALHWAAYCGRKKTVEFLISKDAAHALPSFPPGSGENTPANLAFAAGHQEIGHYLEEKVEQAVAALKFHFDEDDSS